MSKISELCEKLKIEFENFKIDCMLLSTKEIVENKAYEIAMKNCLVNSFEDIMLQNKNSDYNEEFINKLLSEDDTLDFLYTKYFNYTIENKGTHVADFMIKWISKDLNI